MNYSIEMKKTMDQVNIILDGFCPKETLLKYYQDMIDADSRIDYLHKKGMIVKFLKNAGFDCSKGSEDQLLKQMIEKMPNAEEVSCQLVEQFYEIYQKIPSCSQILDYIVSELADEKVKENSENVGTKALMVRQFIYHTKQYRLNLLRFLQLLYPNLANVNKNDIDAYLPYITDDIFVKYHELFNAKQIKTIHILVLVENLYNGYFQSSGKARSNLYLFAHVFHMKYYSRYDERFQQVDSFEKSLLFDYYADNMKRYISKDYLDHRRQVEAEPTALGVNLKNYVEFVHVCYMNRDMNVEDKLKEISTVIKLVEERLSDNYEHNNAYKGPLNYTVRFDELNIDLSSLSKEEIVDFYTSHYPLQKPLTRTTLDVTTYNDETLSAMDEAIFLTGIETFTNNIELFDDENRSPLNQSFLDNHNYFDIGLYNVLMHHQERFQTIINDQDFIDILKKMEQILDITTLKNRLGFHQENQAETTITRTSFITWAFYDFIGDYHEYVDENSVLLFSDIYHEMCNHVNCYLEASRYQSVNLKNLYDVYLLFSAYRYICLSNEDMLW